MYVTNIAFKENIKDVALANITTEVKLAGEKSCSIYLFIFRFLTFE